MADWESRAMCHGLDGAADIFFPDLDEPGRDNHGAEAKAICAQCPVARPCLEAALERGEDHGIWGGAGGDLLQRWLRRAWRARDRDPGRWETTIAQHLDALETGVREVADRNGPGAKHGRRVTYNRGCRCGPCCRSVNDDRVDVRAFDERVASTRDTATVIPITTIRIDRSHVA